jgi:hypothetical protein
MKKGEPPSRSHPMLIGRNSRGQWVVRSLNGLCGGLFVNRSEALRFALFENGHRPDAAIMVNGVLELALNDPVNVAAPNQPGANSDSTDRRSPSHTSRHLMSDQTEARSSLMAPQAQRAATRIKRATRQTTPRQGWHPGALMQK